LGADKTLEITLLQLVTLTWRTALEGKKESSPSIQKQQTPFFEQKREEIQIKALITGPLPYFTILRCFGKERREEEEENAVST